MGDVGHLSIYIYKNDSVGVCYRTSPISTLARALEIFVGERYIQPHGSYGALFPEKLLGNSENGPENGHFSEILKFLKSHNFQTTHPNDFIFSAYYAY